MNQEEKKPKGKRFEAWLGLILLLLPILYVIGVFLQWTFITDLLNLDFIEDFVEMDELSSEVREGLPNFMGLCAIAGAYLLKDNAQYIFKKKEKKEKVAE